MIYYIIIMEKTFFSQEKQDEFLYRYFFKNYTKPGFFIELGALDGVKISNSLFFEKSLGWNGVCIEPLEEYFVNLLKNRKCHKFQEVIYDVEKEVSFISIVGNSCGLSGIKETYDNRHVNRINREVSSHKKNGLKSIVLDEKKKARTLDSILVEVGVKEIDFLSLDTEGSELNVLKSINWEDTNIKVLCVENNYGDENLHKYILEKNYTFLHRLSSDYIYYRKDLITPII